MADRKAFIDALSAQLERWDADLQKLEKSGQAVVGDTRAEYRKQIKALRRKKDTVKGKLEDLRRASDDAWEKMTSGAEEALKDMNQAIHSALSRFK